MFYGTPFLLTSCVIMAEINLSYPVGKFVSTDAPDAAHFQLWIRTIADFPAQLRQAVNELDDAALRWRYRPGWRTVAEYWLAILQRHDLSR